MMNLPLSGKVVLVTGGARRVGAAIVRRLHASGANVVIHFRSARGEAEALRRELESARSASAVLAQADLLDTAHLADLAAVGVDRFGRLDALVNNASSFYPTPVGEISTDAWEDLIGTNLKAPLFLAQAAAASLRATGGAIVNISDIHAERPLRNYVVYCIAKAGLAGLTRSLARELGPQVRVNAIAPGPILWPDDGSFDEATRGRVVANTLLKRPGEPDDIARAVHYLIADAPYVTGQIIAVDGGRSISL